MDWKTRPRCDQTPAWAALQTHHAAKAPFDLRDAFAADSERFAAHSQQAPHVFADLSKNLIDRATEALLIQLARECGLEAHRDAMFAGEAINQTECRAVGHVRLREPRRTGGDDAQLAQVHEALGRMLDYAQAVRADAAITDIVNIGIGGSDLGPQMVVTALHKTWETGKRFHFVSNVDGHELSQVLMSVRPESTLFLVASKTFNTVETMANAHSARRWFSEQGGQDIGRHFAALTSNVKAAQAFGIRTAFGFWDWVGGRYSMWSSIGLPIAIALGRDGFDELLGGAHAMDQHFHREPLASNLPVRLGLLDVWYRNFYGFSSRSIAPYDSRLRRLSAYLQQLEMESNGKRVDLTGRTLSYDTSPVLWGEPGTNGQHAYFQMLHQGTERVPVEFIAVRHPDHALADHHTLLLANALAQAQALMEGHADVGGHRHFPGNRPSTFLVLDELTPTSLGALVALQEHRVFVSGSVWGINSFDQWGVELGKVLAREIAPRMQSGNTDGVDGSTAGLLRRLQQ